MSNTQLESSKASVLLERDTNGDYSSDASDTIQTPDKVSQKYGRKNNIQPNQITIRY
jgi:hypothetical protein